MTRFTVAVLPEAEREFEEAFWWYRERSRTAADAFRSHVLDAIDSLAEHADIWPVSEDGLRFRVVGKFPYTVWYDIDEQLATVVAIAHQHRRPRYWRSGR